MKWFHFRHDYLLLDGSYVNLKNKDGAEFQGLVRIYECTKCGDKYATQTYGYYSDRIAISKAEYMIAHARKKKCECNESE